MPSEDVQVNTRVSQEERDAIKAHGGLRHIIRKFLADNSSDEEKHRQEIEKLQVKLIEIQVEINKHTESAEKLKAQREHSEKSGTEATKKPEKESLLFNGRRVAPKIESPREWERGHKLLYLMLHARDGKLSVANEQAAIKHLELRPPQTVLGWLYSPTPETMSMERLEKCRQTEQLSLISLKREGKINEQFYKLLMMWLNCPTKEDVDDWILKGIEKDEGERAS